MIWPAHPVLTIAAGPHWSVDILIDAVGVSQLRIDCHRLHFYYRYVSLYIALIV
jgi:hypothetical protein